MEALLGYLYGIQPNTTISTWRQWLTLRCAADKYLLRLLHKIADASMVAEINATTEPDEIFAIIRTLKHDHGHDDSLATLAESLRFDHLRNLIDNKDYRSYLDEDKERLWDQLDELSFAAGCEKKRLVCCKVCHKIWWSEDHDEHEAMTSACVRKGRRTSSGGRHQIERIWCWVVRGSVPRE